MRCLCPGPAERAAASLTVHVVRTLRHGPEPGASRVGPLANPAPSCLERAGSGLNQLNCSFLLRLSRQGRLCWHRPRTALLCSAPGAPAVSLLSPRQGLSVPAPSQGEPWWWCARCSHRLHRLGSARSLSLLSGTWLPALLSGSCCLSACAVMCPLSCHTSSGSWCHRLVRWPRGRSHSTRICHPSAVSAVCGWASIDSTARSHPL